MEEWIKTLRRFARNKKAISGLETAIVLIAFVIVASAFAYAVLNMGFLATQKSQEVVVGGLAAASSAVVVDGPVYGYSAQSGAAANVTTIIFWLKTAAGADSVDLNVNKTTIGFQNPRGVWPNVYNTGGGNLTYTVSSTTYKCVYNGANVALKVEWEVGQGYTLDRNEKVRITVYLDFLWTSADIGYGAAADTHPGGWVAKNEQFKIIVKPPTGSVLDIVRYAPPEVKTVNDLG
jgi:flagellin FlaB